jgi:hypothetical protein
MSRNGHMLVVIIIQLIGQMFATAAPSLLTLASLFSRKFNAFPDYQQLRVHHGVDSVLFDRLAEPFDFIVSKL